MYCRQDLPPASIKPIVGKAEGTPCLGAAPSVLVAATAGRLRQAFSSFTLLLTLALGRLRNKGERLGSSTSISADLRLEYSPSEAATPGPQEAADPPTKALLIPSNAKVPVQPPSEAALGTLCLMLLPKGSPAPATRTPGMAAGRFAYVTLLTRDSYLKGVQCLARSLRAAAAGAPLLVMYTPDTLSSSAVQALEQEGCCGVPVKRYLPEGRQDFGLYKMPGYAECWTKLRMWELEGFDRLVYLDADMVVTRNIDVLFSLPPGFYATADCSFGRLTQEERDSCPLFCPSRPSYFNAGFYIMTPSATDFGRFGTQLSSGAVTVGGYAEQDFLNTYYKATWRPLPYTFNAQKVIKLHHPELFKLEDVSVIHYVDDKPWDRDSPAHGPYKDLVDLWWSIFQGRFAPRIPATLPSVALAC